jgi:putative endonuclease
MTSPDRIILAESLPLSLDEDHCAAGRRGEAYALAFLKSQGFSLIKQNYRHGRGEIDLVMEDSDQTLVFVEVKSNRTKASGHPLERIDNKKIRRLQRMAQRYCLEFNQADRDMRFDVVGVDMSKKGEPTILHVPGAFIPDASGYYPSR